MSTRIIAFLLLLLLHGNLALAASELTTHDTNTDPDLKLVEQLLLQPESSIDIAKSRLSIEKLIDSSVDIKAALREIDRIVEAIKGVPRYADSTEGKLNAIIQYLYLPGSWNDNNPYHYDFDDPLGTAKPKNSRVSNFLKTRRGNCVSMPLLVLILGERLGLNMSLVTAPLHLFVRLEDKGHHYNFEATAGGLKAESTYVKDFNITPVALKNGIYLRNLSKKQAITVMLNELASHYSSKSQNNKDFDKAFALTDLALKQYPNNVPAMLIRGNIWRNILHRDVEAFKVKRVKLTQPIKKHFDELLKRNLQWYAKAEALGWREPPKEYEERYLKMVNEARKYYE